MTHVPPCEPGDHAEYYATYTRLVTGGNILDVLTRQRDELINLLGSLDEGRGDHRYAEGKWTIKGVLGHLIDTERLFSFRALWIARGDAQPQPGMDENGWADESNADRRHLGDMLGEYRTVRDASLWLFRSLDGELWERRGIASGHEVAVRAFPSILAGHERHHLNVLQDRYLS